MLNLVSIRELRADEVECCSPSRRLADESAAAATRLA